MGWIFRELFLQAFKGGTPEERKELVRYGGGC